MRGCQAEVVAVGGGLVAGRSEQARQKLMAECPDLACRGAEIAQAATADVVCTMTPSRAPIVRDAWVSGDTHINAMGADAPGKQELDPEILRKARVFLDDTEQATESGEVNVSLRQGQLRREAIAGTLGRVVAGLLSGRQGGGVTVFDSTGLAAQDLAVARAVYRQACDRGIGTEIELIEL